MGQQLIKINNARLI